MYISIGEHASNVPEGSAQNKNSISKPTPLARKIFPPEKSPKEESVSPSKIPVKRKTSREALKTDISPQMDHSSITSKKTETAQSGLSSPETEVPKHVKTNTNFEVHSLKEMQGEQEPVLDKGQFMSLRKFWEKGAGNSGNGSNSHLEQEAEDAKSLDESPEKPNHSIPIQSTTKVNSEERSQPEYAHRLKYFSQRPQVVSSSEDEMVHVVHHRKTPTSSIPRSTYAKSKGSSNSRSVSLSESNGTTSHSEDNSGVNRSSKKSKLPVRASKGDPTSSPKDKSPTTSASEITDSVEEMIIPQSKPEVKESLYSRVQILIDTVSSDEEQGGEDNKPKSGDLTGHSPLETENGIHICILFISVFTAKLGYFRS